MGKTFVIAEAACTWHIGTSTIKHLSKMLKCIHIAKEAGADACKFQWTSAPAEMAQRRNISNVGTYHRLAWPKEWFPILAAECEDHGIEFMCSVYLERDIETVRPFINRLKVASLEAHDGKFCQSCIDADKQVIISVMGGERRDIDKFFPEKTMQWTNIKLLHCIAGYPAPVAQLNLKCLNAKFVRTFDGLSDHSGDLLTGAIAVGAGVEIVEVHFRLDETRKDNPDYPHSHPPNGLKQYIANIRKAELMMGDGVKKIEDCERPLVKHRVTA